MTQELADIARRYVLQNAVLHGGQADPKSTMGRIMGAEPTMRAHAKDLAPLLASLAAEINALSEEEQKAQLDAVAPELATVQKRERKTGLKELKNAEKGKVVLRFAPNPNGPLSFGHGRGVSILAQYAKDYDAQLVLRLDDTDPQVKPPLMDVERGWNGYEMVKEDFTWLAGFEPHRVVKASDRQEVYYAAARELIRRGGAYVCTLDAELWREMKARSEPSPSRELPIEDQLAAFERMVDGTYKQGEAVLRVKTDMDHKDPALRDWVAFRIVQADAIHPREALGEIPHYSCWPLLDFQSAVEDHEQGVTHIIRGKDLMDSTRKQMFLYEHMGWTYPETMYWGRVKIHEFGKFSTSAMRKSIEAGEYEGWDDVRLPTLRALARRGFSADAMRSYWIQLGISEKDIAASMENLEAENAKVAESSPRAFFVPQPRAFAFEGPDELVANPMRHPSHPDQGTRTLEPGSRVVVSEGDLGDKPLRLKDLGNVGRVDDALVFEGEELDRSRSIVQWLPANAPAFRVLRSAGVPDDAETGYVPGLDTIEGQVEPWVRDEVGKIVQFERFGFVRIESADTGVWLHA